MQCREKAHATLVLCVSIAGVTLVLGSCQTHTQAAAPAPAATSAPQQVQPVVDAAEIQALLDGAEAAMQRGQLTYPAEDSALVLFDRVLVMEPDNVEAQRGLERIAEHYLERAETAVQRNQLADARAMLEWARMVDANHPDLAITQARINLLANARRKRLPLDTTALRERSAELRQPLQGLGAQARDASCRATIRVRSDAEGRWVYQQMSLAPGDARIRAEIQIGSPPLVELVCFQDG